MVTGWARWLGRLHPAQGDAPALPHQLVKNGQPPAGGCAVGHGHHRVVMSVTNHDHQKAWPSHIKARRLEEQTLASEANRQPRVTRSLWRGPGGGTKHGPSLNLCGRPDGWRGTRTRPSREPAAARTGPGGCTRPSGDRCGTNGHGDRRWDRAGRCRPAKQPGRAGAKRGRRERTRPAGRQAPGLPARTGGPASARAPVPLGPPPARGAFGATLTPARQVLAPAKTDELSIIRWSDGIPLDVSRRDRTETPAIRRALDARDLGLPRARLRHARPLVHRPSPETLEPRRYSPTSRTLPCSASCTTTTSFICWAGRPPNTHRIPALHPPHGLAHPRQPATGRGHQTYRRDPGEQVGSGPNDHPLTDTAEACGAATAR